MQTHNNTRELLAAQNLRANHAKELAADNLARKVEGIFVLVLLAAVTLGVALFASGALHF